MPRPSEIMRQGGIGFERKYGLIRCACANHLIIARGQKRRLCPYCGRRFWLAGHHVIAQSDHLELLQKFMGGKGNYYRPDSFITADNVLAHRMSLAAGTTARSVSTRIRRPGHDDGSAAT